MGSLDDCVSPTCIANSLAFGHVHWDTPWLNNQQQCHQQCSPCDAATHAFSADYLPHGFPYTQNFMKHLVVSQNRGRHPLFITYSHKPTMLGVPVMTWDTPGRSGPVLQRRAKVSKVSPSLDLLGLLQAWSPAPITNPSSTHYQPSMTRAMINNGLMTIVMVNDGYSYCFHCLLFLNKAMINRESIINSSWTTTTAILNTRGAEEKKKRP